jgi:ribosomal protein L30/L7E
MRTMPLVRQYHPSIVNTDLDVYKIKDRVMASPINNHPDPFQVIDRLGINKINATKIRTVVYNSKGLFYII